MVTKAGVGVILAGIGEIIGQDMGGGIDRIATIITGPGVQGLSGTEILLSLFMVHTMKVMMVRVRAHAKTNILRMSRREMRARARSDDAHHGILQEFRSWCFGSQMAVPSFDAGSAGEDL